jgi:hypothetical protein
LLICFGSALPNEKKPAVTDKGFVELIGQYTVAPPHCRNEDEPAGLQRERGGKTKSASSSVTHEGGQPDQ